MKTASRDVFHAVADTNRRMILDLLLEKELPVQEIVKHFNLSFQGVSQHLAVLAEAGLVSRRKLGRYRYYRAEPFALEEIHDWVEGYRRFWQRRLRNLKSYLDEEK